MPPQGLLEGAFLKYNLLTTWLHGAEGRQEDRAGTTLKSISTHFSSRLALRSDDGGGSSHNHGAEPLNAPSWQRKET